MRSDLKPDTTYMDILRVSATKDKFYEKCLGKFRQDGQFSKALGLMEVLKKNKCDINWRDYAKVAFLK